jgi:putative nucleotidyltransferase with HDIG domain
MQTRAEVIQGAQQSNAEEVFENPENAECYNVAKDAAGKYVSFIMSNAQAMQSVMKIENTDKNISHHGVTVATLAIALAGKLGINDPKKTQLLTLGSLLHDYGHHNSPLNLNQPLSAMSPADLAIWKRHPAEGASRVQDKKHFDQTVLNIIAQHEETIDGQGPMGMKEKEQDPLSIIASTANAVDRLITFEGVAQAEVAKKLMIDSVGKHPLQHLQFIGEIMKGT